MQMSNIGMKYSSMCLARFVATFRPIFSTKDIQLLPFLSSLSPPVCSNADSIARETVAQPNNANNRINVDVFIHHPQGVLRVSNIAREGGSIQVALSRVSTQRFLVDVNSFNHSAVFHPRGEAWFPVVL